MSENKKDPKIEIDVTVNLTIKGKTVQLTLDELKGLQDKIKEILNYVKETQYVPTYPIYRDPLVPEPYPWGDQPWVNPKTSPNPIITWGVNSRTKGEI